MKAVSFSVFLSIIAVSGAEAFAPNGRAFVAPATQQTLEASNPFLVRGGAQQQLKPKRNFRYTTFSASVGTTASDDKGDTNLLQSVASAQLTKAVLSSTLFVFTDMLIKNIFKAKAISFPSSLAGCCFLAATLLASPFHKKLYEILNPGAKLMQKFMMIFLVPNLIVLPLCGGNYSALEMARSRQSSLAVFYFPSCRRAIQ